MREGLPVQVDEGVKHHIYEVKHVYIVCVCLCDVSVIYKHSIINNRYHSVVK